MALNYTSVNRMLALVPALSEVRSLNSAQLVMFAEAAESEVDGAIAKSYVVPVPGGPPLLTTVATDLALYRVLSQRVFTQERLKDSVWPGVFKEARAILKEIAEGVRPLVDSSYAIIAGRSTVAATSNTKDYLPTFTELDPEQASVDCNKLDDLANERSNSY